MLVDARRAAPEALVHARVSGLRRLAALAIDYFLFAIYLGVLVFVAFVVTGGRLEFEGASGPGAKQALSALTITLPMLLYFAICEASCWRGTVGKRATWLEVVDAAGRPIGLFRSFLRSALKLVPFQLALGFVHLVPKTGDIPWTAWTLLAVSLALAVAWIAGLFAAGRRTPYDLLAGTRVVRVS